MMLYPVAYRAEVWVPTRLTTSDEDGPCSQHSHNDSPDWLMDRPYGDVGGQWNRRIRWHGRATSGPYSPATNDYLIAMGG